MASRYYSDRTLKLLYGLSGAVCSKCKRQLIFTDEDSNDPAQIAKICHIVGFSENGPRGDPNFPKEKLNEYENLILLCGACHDEVDLMTKIYTIPKLLEMKKNHVEWFLNSIDEGCVEFGIPELDLIVEIISSGKYSEIPSDISFDHICISEKIDKNEFNNEIKGLIKTGLGRTSEVKDYFKEINAIHENFIPKLKYLFKEEYNKLKQDEKDNDTIFLELWSLLDKKYSSISEKSAALTVLVYMFELCEVFEKWFYLTNTLMKKTP